jgi:hypothetical protein
MNTQSMQKIEGAAIAVFPITALGGVVVSTSSMGATSALMQAMGIVLLVAAAGLDLSASWLSHARAHRERENGESGRGPRPILSDATLRDPSEAPVRTRTRADRQTIMSESGHCSMQDTEEFILDTADPADAMRLW